MMFSNNRINNRSKNSLLKIKIKMSNKRKFLLNKRNKSKNRTNQMI